MDLENLCEMQIRYYYLMHSKPTQMDLPSKENKNNVEVLHKALLKPKPREITLEKIFLSDLLGILKYRDLRSVRRWCFNNKVKLFLDPISKRRFVWKVDLEKALNQNQ